MRNLSLQITLQLAAVFLVMGLSACGGTQLSDTNAEPILSCVPTCGVEETTTPEAGKENEGVEVEVTSPTDSLQYCDADNAQCDLNYCRGRILGVAGFGPVEDIVISDDASLEKIQQCRGVRGKLIFALDDDKEALELPRLQELYGGIEISEHHYLQQITADSLRRVRGDIRLSNLPALESLSFSSLESLIGNLVLGAAPLADEQNLDSAFAMLQRVEFSALSFVNGGIELSGMMGGMISFPNLAELRGDLSVNQSSVMSNAFPELQVLDGSLKLKASCMDDALTWSNLSELTGGLELSYISPRECGEGQGNAAFAMSNLALVGGDIRIVKSELANLSLPMLEQVAGSMVLSELILVSGATLVFPSLEAVDGDFTVAGIASESLALDQLKRVEGDLYLGRADSTVQESCDSLALPNSLPSSLELPLLESATNLIVDCAKGLESLLLPEMRVVVSTFHVLNNDSLINISSPELVAVQDYFWLTNNVQLETIDLENLEAIGNTVSTANMLPIVKLTENLMLDTKTLIERLFESVGSRGDLIINDERFQKPFPVF